MQPNPHSARRSAYEDENFLDSEDGRPVRILTEYLGPLHRFRRANSPRHRSCSSGRRGCRADGPLGRYYQEARELARLITLWSKGLSVARTSLCRLLRRRRRHHGGGQPGCRRGRRQNDRAQHQLCRMNSGPIPMSRASCRSSFTTSSCASFGSRIWPERWWCFPAASARSTNSPRY